MKGFARLGTTVLGPWVWLLLTSIGVVLNRETMGWSALPALAASTVVTVAVLATLTRGFGLGISPHATASTGGVVVLTFTFGPPALLAGLLVAWVCWSRMKLGQDTYPETAAGALVGLLVSGLGFWLALIVVHLS